ncbi:MAG: glucosaminidase domain-containing protein [Alcanivoracaceae bacterium]|jgi:Bax protein|nr:glucosaminidase domain-containing protein [Alcanivoracaceae bacterium]
MQSSPWRRALLINIVLWMLLAPLAVTSWQHAHFQAPPVWPLPDDPVAARKARLINNLLPHIHAANRALIADRQRLQKLQQQLADGKSLRRNDRQWLARQRELYRINEERAEDGAIAELLRRVDIIPSDLALAQAALESAWGQSRFSRQGNNYFGQWCFTDGCGLVPRQRPDGARHEVAVFATPASSVRAYMRNLNSHPRYAMLRRLRAQQRQQGKEPSGYQMAAGLEGYSAIGQQYVRTVRGLIRSNDLSRFTLPAQGSAYH